MFILSFAALPDEWDLQDLENYYIYDCAGRHANTAQTEKYNKEKCFNGTVVLSIQLNCLCLRRTG